MLEPQWAMQTVNGGLLAFDRHSGLNILSRNEQTTQFRRQAPRVLQVGLLTPCNLSCVFCYRDTSAPSRLSREYLFDLLSKAARWGVLEVAFGGGEPLLFRGFAELVRDLHEHTTLGINFTTNGMLLTPRLLDELSPAIGEIRLSAYPDNHYRRTLKMLAGRRTGINLLVTPQNLGQVEIIVRDCLTLGARNVLLLGYKGEDPAVHLSPLQIERLRRAIVRMESLPLRLDICWYPLLADLPHLFARADCGAGDEFLVITPDRAVQPCSFHHERVPFESFEDLQRIYDSLRERQPSAEIRGCTRSQFVPIESLHAKPPVGDWIWTARASNNSGDWTIVGRFREVQQAEKAAQALRELARAHEAFLASPQATSWIEANNFHYDIPTPPLQKFGTKHGFDWSQQGEGLSWEEEGCGAPVLTAGAVGKTVVVYHPYCMGLPEDPFRKFFDAAGATDFGYWQYDRPSVIIAAKGANPDAVAAIEAYLDLVDEADYPGEILTPPPWGVTCEDSRLLDDEDRSTLLTQGPWAIGKTNDGLHLELRFQNTFAGTIAIANWLVASGYEDVTTHVNYGLEQPGDDAESSSQFKPKVSEGRRSRAERARVMTPEELLEAVFAYRSDAPDELQQALIENVNLAVIRQCWQTHREAGENVDLQALQLIEKLGRDAADWLRDMFWLLTQENSATAPLALHTMTVVLRPDESFDRASQWLARSADGRQHTERLMSFGELQNPATVPLIEQWWQQAEPATPVGPEWGQLAAGSRIDWSTLRRWIESDRPLSLVALDALKNYAQRLPDSFARPSRAELAEVLNACTVKDAAPRAVSAAQRILKAADKLAAD